jgi:hypothetical protein
MSTQLSQQAFRPNSLTDSLLIPCPNGLEEVGSNRNKLVLNPHLLAVKDLKRFFGFGQLLGCAIRSSTCIPLDMSRLFWTLLLHGVEGVLAGEATEAFERGMAELRRVDWNAAAMLSYIGQVAHEDEFLALGLTYSTALSGGVLVDLFPGGSHQVVEFADRRKYVRLILFHRLNEGCCALQAIRLGIRSILPSTAPCFASTLLLGGEQLAEFLPTPSGPFHLLDAEELELLVCGAREVDLALLRKHTTYKNTQEDSAVVRNFWACLDGFTPEDRARFLQFAWGRSRLPANFTSTQQHMTVNEENHRRGLLDVVSNQPVDSSVFSMLLLRSRVSVECDRPPAMVEGEIFCRWWYCIFLVVGHSRWSS